MVSAATNLNSFHVMSNFDCRQIYWQLSQFIKTSRYYGRVNNGNNTTKKSRRRRQIHSRYGYRFQCPQEPRHGRNQGDDNRYHLAMVPVAVTPNTNDLFLRHRPVRQHVVRNEDKGRKVLVSPHHHRCELPGNYPDFTVVMVIYTFVRRISIITLPPNFF